MDAIYNELIADIQLNRQRFLENIIKKETYRADNESKNKKSKKEEVVYATSSKALELMGKIAKHVDSGGKLHEGSPVAAVFTFIRKVLGLYPPEAAAIIGSDDD
ncbi:hypothetical protein TNIN_61801 [Trichonephila inaurata madagascariensis]|uniref:Uncharacterized protein n=1 Tax=Trichonephila inaurata madagascariensis TaxID=2747483 RepID=A0A8X6WRG0_9ARAC|nr:hypothetical protein TNIN_61801 [Trichonephila inaurata madagascariensis]